MIRSASSGDVTLGSASAWSAALFASSPAIDSSEPTTTRTTSRPSSDSPIVKTCTRGEASASARM